MILVTGSTGLLGGHLLYELLRNHDRVAALKRPSAKTDTLREILSYYSSDPDQLMDRIDWRTGDLMDPGSLTEAIKGISVVINCAAIVSFNPHDKEMMIANNVRGTRNLGDAIRRQGDGKTLLIHLSSTSALGDGPGNDPGFMIDEDTPRNPGLRHTGYSVSKYESERALGETGVNAVILNPAIILGPGQWEKGSSQLFVKAWQGLKYYPYGGTGYVDARDVAGIITQIINQLSVIGCQEPESPDLRLLATSLIGERFCLVGANLRYREFFNLVTDEFGKPNPHIYAGRLLSGIAWRADSLKALLTGRKPLLTRETAEAAQRISYYSSEKIRKILKFEFRPVEETIAWTSACFRMSNRQPKP